MSDWIRTLIIVFFAFVSTSSFAEEGESYVLGSRLVNRQTGDYLQLNCEILNDDPQTRDRLPCLIHQFKLYKQAENKLDSLGMLFTLDESSLDPESQRSYRSALRRALRATKNKSMKSERDEIKKSLKGVGIGVGIVGLMRLVSKDAAVAMGVITMGWFVVASEPFFHSASVMAFGSPNTDQLGNHTRENFAIRSKKVSHKRFERMVEQIRMGSTDDYHFRAYDIYHQYHERQRERLKNAEN